MVLVPIISVRLGATANNICELNLSAVIAFILFLPSFFLSLFATLTGSLSLTQTKTALRLTKALQKTKPMTTVPTGHSSIKFEIRIFACWRRSMLAQSLILWSKRKKWNLVSSKCCCKCSAIVWTEINDYLFISYITHPPPQGDIVWKGG